MLANSVYWRGMAQQYIDLILLINKSWFEGQFESTVHALWNKDLKAHRQTSKSQGKCHVLIPLTLTWKSISSIRFSLTCHSVLVLAAAMREHARLESKRTFFYTGSHFPLS